MGETQILITGIVTIIGAITTLLVRGRIIQKNKDEALILKPNERYSYLLAKGENLPLDKVEKLSDKGYKDLVNKIYDQKEKKQQRYFTLSYVLIFVLAVLYGLNFFFLDKFTDKENSKFVKFSDSDSIKIAVFPFKHYDGRSSDDLANSLFEAFLKETRYGLVKITIQKLNNLPLSLEDKERERIAANINADVIIWGSVENVEKNIKKSSVRYLFRTLKEGHFEILEKQDSFKSYIEEVEEGLLTDDFNGVIYLFQGLTYLSEEHNFRKANFCAERIFEMAKDNEALRGAANILSLFSLIFSEAYFSMKKDSTYIVDLPNEYYLDVGELYELDHKKKMNKTKSILDGADY